MKMKKMLAACVCMVMAAAMVTGCGSSKPADSSAPAADSSTASSQAAKSDYPQKPINAIVPFAPGGGSDILTRSLMDFLELPNNQKLVVVNVEGAAGYIGCQQAFNSPNDGYTILAHNPMDVVSYTLGGTTEQELYKELELICGVADDFNFLTTNKETGWTSLEEVVEYAKANPGKIKVGNTGSMNCNMADCIRVLEALGIKDLVTIVPYNSGADNKVANMGNHTQLSINTGADITSAVASGDQVPLLVISDRRSKSLPDVPCTKELGYDVVTTKPRGFYGPKGMSPEQITILQDAIKAACENEAFQQKILDLGLEVNYVPGAELQTKIDGWVEDIKPVFEIMKEQG
ncbi:MAG: tripartite tricarboxylate transporter substrate binding protein [Angelakisella sp.]|nr:tripartite tricarboxylate transporter substrate binding protein [Angelakisella sp.]